MVAFFSRSERDVSVDSDGDTVVVATDDATVELSRREAVALQEAIGDAVTETREFFRTAGTHREDGSYEVSRRGADSAGNAKVFPDFGAVERLFERLPTEFDADAVGRTGITGSRRHMLVRHFAEHPAFSCEITSRNPLAARKTGDAGGDPAVDADPAGEPEVTAD